jgi:hypothetical protein
MRTKLKLNLDQLTVDSFRTDTEPAQKGTVFGEQCTCHTECTCPGCPSCDATCAGQYTCDNTCPESCYGTCYGGNTCGDFSCDTACHRC